MLCGMSMKTMYVYVERGIFRFGTSSASSSNPSAMTSVRVSFAKILRSIRAPPDFMLRSCGCRRRAFDRSWQIDLEPGRKRDQAPLPRRRAVVFDPPLGQLGPVARSLMHVQIAEVVQRGLPPLGTIALYQLFVDLDRLVVLGGLRIAG